MGKQKLIEEKETKIDKKGGEKNVEDRKRYYG
jgi:hypothetical protein